MSALAIAGAQTAAGDLFQRYRPQSELGRGPLATIYHALDEQGQPVALKLFDTRFGHEPRFAVRFRHHLKAVVGLNHPNLVTVLDYGLAGERFYIVYELVEGSNLATLLAEQGALWPDMAADVVRQICSGLQAAHERGLVHRSLKPENVLLDREGRVKVVDVGLSSLLSESGLSRTSVVLHGVNYMAPEQGSGHHAGPAADIYSAGVILFEAVAARPPFVAGDVWRVVQMHLQTQPPSLRRLNAGTPPELEAVVERALRKEPDDRFATAGEMAAALAPLASRAAVLSLPLAPQTTAPKRPVATSHPTFGHARRRARELLAEIRDNGAPRSQRTAGWLLLLQFVLTFVLTFLLLLALTGS
jgi:serine/threonine-protein kinase